MTEEEKAAKEAAEKAEKEAAEKAEKAKSDSTPKPSAKPIRKGPPMRPRETDQEPDTATAVRASKTTPQEEFEWEYPGGGEG